MPAEANHTTDVEIARAVIADLERVIEGARADIGIRGGSANPTSSALLACLLGVAGAARFGGRDLAEMMDAITICARRGLHRAGVER